MWKTIFGKKKPLNEMEKIASDFHSGKYPVYPILKPGNWPGIKAGAIKQTLVGSPDNPEVVLGYGYDTPENFIFLTHQHMQTLNSKEVVDNANANLKNYKAQLTYSEKLDKQVLFGSGEDFSSEKILVREYMQQAHKMLDAEEVIVSIPRRRCMMVVNRDNKQLIKTFLDLHLRAWHEDDYGNAPITKLLFILKDGDIQGTYDLDVK
ncbi:MAG: DUF1444 family protein [Cyclobacteriaceae bacterium]